MAMRMTLQVGEAFRNRTTHRDVLVLDAFPCVLDICGLFSRKTMWRDQLLLEIVPLEQFPDGQEAVCQSSLRLAYAGPIPGPPALRESKS
jgi:hypothetical protein